MKRLIIVFLIFALLIPLLLMQGCGEKEAQPPSDEAIWFDETLQSQVELSNGMVVRLEENILSTQAEYICVVYENPTNQTYQFGEHFYIDWLNEEGAWERLDSTGFTDIGYILTEHDIIRQTFWLSSNTRETLSKGRYRILVEAFDCYLEFRVEEEGACPKGHDIQSNFLTSLKNLPPLEKEWQWYRWQDFWRLFKANGKEVPKFVLSKDESLLALLWRRDDHKDNEDDNTRYNLTIINRKTGEMKQVFLWPMITKDCVQATETGFSYELNGRIYEVKLPKNWQ